MGLLNHPSRVRIDAQPSPVEVSAELSPRSLYSVEVDPSNVVITKQTAVYVLGSIGRYLQENRPPEEVLAASSMLTELFSPETNSAIVLEIDHLVRELGHISRA